jgi:hypothetical protein
VIASGLKVQTVNNAGNAITELDANLNVRSFSFSDSYWPVHRDLESKGLLSHSADTCPEHTRPQPFGEWTAERGWTQSTLVPTVQQTTARR